MKKENLLRWIAWHLPRNIAYWCAVRVNVAATQGEWENQEVSELLAIDAITRWRPVKPNYPKGANE